MKVTASMKRAPAREKARFSRAVIADGIPTAYARNKALEERVAAALKESPKPAPAGVPSTCFSGQVSLTLREAQRLKLLLDASLEALSVVNDVDYPTRKLDWELSKKLEKAADPFWNC